MNLAKSTVILLFLGCYTLFAQGQHSVFSDTEYNYHIAQTQVFRADQDIKFKNEEKSPLILDSIPNFNGLDYFEIDPSYIVPATYKRLKNGRIFEMKTTTNRLPEYQDFAELTFKLGDSTYTLHAYQNVVFSKKPDYDSSLFVPFNDYTNGIESYGGGRYIDIKIPKGNLLILDFNRSYNPYCAYNDKYSCPIPPHENKLKLRIEAGVKKYHWSNKSLNLCVLNKELPNSLHNACFFYFARL